MRLPRLACLLAIQALGLPVPMSAQSRDSVELVRLETAWNQAHVAGDTIALAALWAPELVATVPSMPPMTRNELLAFWRSGRSAISRYESDSIVVQLAGDSATVLGSLRRERVFSGRAAVDQWRFVKTYRRTSQGWQVVSFRAFLPTP